MLEEAKKKPIELLSPFLLWKNKQRVVSLRCLHCVKPTKCFPGYPLSKKHSQPHFVQMLPSTAELAVPLPPARLTARVSFHFHLLTCWNSHLGSGFPAGNKIRISQALCCKANQDKTQLSVQPWECNSIRSQPQCLVKEGSDTLDYIPQSKIDATSHF